MGALGSGRKARAMRFVTLETGCMVCLSHRPNKDGYLRKRWSSSRGADGHLEFFHRTIYRAHRGEIPEDFEIDHICRIRLCCNPAHLEARPRTEHLVLTNMMRYAGRTAKAKAYWKEHPGVSGADLAREFGVNNATALLWLEKWTGHTRRGRKL